MALIPGPAWDKKHKISARTRHRWIEQGILPPPKYINRRQYFDDDLEPNFDNIGRGRPTARQLEARS
jgi:hypothetical protein